MTPRSCSPQVEPDMALLDHWSEVGYLRPSLSCTRRWNSGNSAVARGSISVEHLVPRWTLLLLKTITAFRGPVICQESIDIRDACTRLYSYLAQSHAMQRAHALPLRLTTGDHDTTSPERVSGCQTEKRFLSLSDLQPLCRLRQMARFSCVCRSSYFMKILVVVRHLSNIRHSCELSTTCFPHKDSYI